MKIGILGGTFNPIHFGHLHIAEEVMVACGLDQVWFVPTCQPPHKSLAEEVSFAQRLEMVNAAIAGDGRFLACDMEGRRGGKSFSVTTLELLREQYPEHEFFFIMGLDSFREVGSWKSYHRLFELAHIVVTARPGFTGDPRQLLPVAIADRFCYDADAEKLRHDAGFTVIFVSHTSRDISSTRVRQAVADGEAIDGLVPAAVIDCIDCHHLYTTAAPSD
ncbi:MAG: nicotinate (nicotinamide) nucleotide adenylyltransferase [Desulfuromonas sp.]|jgi:nicotinate-nucleotide adenylyltransferase|nr:MAG: nicotinate (nicotinamide) nucleotide adenylyltransferase [Desulfuromonas sp.]